MSALILSCSAWYAAWSGFPVPVVALASASSRSSSAPAGVVLAGAVAVVVAADLWPLPSTGPAEGFCAFLALGGMVNGYGDVRPGKES